MLPKEVREIFQMLLPNADIVERYVKSDSERIGRISTLLHDIQGKSGLTSDQVKNVRQLIGPDDNPVNKRVNHFARCILDADMISKQVVPSLTNYLRLYKIDTTGSTSSVGSMFGFCLNLFEELNLNTEHLLKVIPQRHEGRIVDELDVTAIRHKRIQERFEKMLNQGRLGDANLLIEMTEVDEGIRNAQQINRVGSYPSFITLLYELFSQRAGIPLYFDSTQNAERLHYKGQHNIPTDVLEFNIPEFFVSIDWLIKVMVLRYPFLNRIPMVQRFVVTAGNAVPSVLHLAMKYYHAMNDSLGDVVDSESSVFTLSTQLLMFLGDSGIQTLEVSRRLENTVIRFKIVNNGINFRILDGSNLDTDLENCKNLLNSKLEPHKLDVTNEQIDDSSVRLAMLYADMLYNPNDFEVNLSTEQRERLSHHKKRAVAHLTTTVAYGVISSYLLLMKPNRVDCVISAMVMALSHHATNALVPQKHADDEHAIDITHELIRFTWSVIIEGSFTYLSSHVQSVVSLAALHLIAPPVKTTMLEHLSKVTIKTVRVAKALRLRSVEMKDQHEVRSEGSDIKAAKIFDELCSIVTSPGMCTIITVGLIESLPTLSPTYQRGSDSIFNRLFAFSCYSTLFALKALYKEEDATNIPTHNDSEHAVEETNDHVPIDNVRDNIQKIQRCLDREVIVLVGFALVLELLMHDMLLPFETRYFARLGYDYIIMPYMLTKLYDVPIASAQHGLIKELGEQIGSLKLVNKEKND